MDLYIKPEQEVRELYEGHTFYHDGDSGYDIFFAEDQAIPAKATALVDFKITCEMRIRTFSKTPGSIKNRSYLLMPRSSIGKTPLRLANSIGLIDSKYRGHIMAYIDNTSDSDWVIKKGERLFQLVGPDFRQFTPVVTDKPLTETTRGDGGFGSTGTGTTKQN